jgi:hypothetical protein
MKKIPGKCEDWCQLCARGMCIECKPGLKFVVEGICAKQCPDQGTYFDISLQKCLSCELFDAKDMKLHPVVVKVPELPYITNFPFPIRYTSRDANLLCVTFELRERVVGTRTVNIIPISNVEE